MAWIGYKLPARAAEELRWMYSIHFSSNPTKNVDELTVSKCGLSKLPSCLYWDGPVRGAEIEGLTILLRTHSSKDLY